MEGKLMKFINENKWFIVFYLTWLFIHIIFLFNIMTFNNFPYRWKHNEFWPFGDSSLFYYDWLEFFVYVGLPLLIFAIVKLVGKDIKKAIDENN